MATSSRADLSGLVDFDQGFVSRKIFSDPEIYRMEQEQIFARCWLYLGHESQLPNPGDYINVFMGEEPVLVVRNRKGKINAFINSCRHRGNRVCRSDAGNTAAFLCTYHGWTYDLDGKLTGVPGHQELYHGELSRENWGLPSVAQLDSYKGLIFATFDPDAPSLDEYLGDIRWGLDLLVEQGDMVAVPGVVRWRMNANWKFATDNAGDMYHGNITHRSARIAGHRAADGDPSGRLTANRKRSIISGKIGRPGTVMLAEYGHHTLGVLDDDDLTASTTYWKRDPEVVKRMGPLRTRLSRSNQSVFPNLWVNTGSRELTLRQPVGPTTVEIWKTTLVDRNAPPEAREEFRFFSNRHFGPAGMFEMDDGENWDQSTYGSRGNVVRQFDLNYTMGLGHGEIIEDELGPPRIESLYHEYAQRWLYGNWADYMASPDWKHMREHHRRPTPGTFV